MKKTAYAIPFFCIGTLPIILLVIKGIGEWWFESGTLKLGVFSPEREGILILKTLVYSLSVSVTVCFIGLLFAVFVCAYGTTTISKYSWVLLISLPIPACVHSLTWLKWSGVINSLGLLKVVSRGWVMSWFVQSMALLPIAVLIIAGGVLSINKEQIMAAQILGKDTRFLLRLFPGYIRPQLIAAGTIIFILTINDYAIPSIFSVNVYSLDIFVEYSSSLSMSRTMIKSLPFIFLEAAALIFSLNLISKVFLSGKKSEITNIKFHFPKTVKVLSLSSVIFVIIQLVAPFSVVLLDKTMWSELGLTILNTAADISTSVQICVVASILSIPIIYMTAVWLKNTRFKKTGLFFVILPSILPAALIGAAYINLFNHQQTDLVYNSILMPSFVVMARFMPFGVIATLAWLNRVDKSLTDAADILESNKMRTSIYIILPMVSTGIILGIAMIFLFGLGELGATIMVLPPGSSTVTVRLYNYLHYGSTEMVLGLSFILSIIIVLIFSGLKLFSRSGLYDRISKSI